METASKSPPVKPFDAALREKAEAYIARRKDRLASKGQKYTYRDAAKEWDTNESAVSRYIDGKPIGDVERLERLIRISLLNEERRQSVIHELFETSVSIEVEHYLNTIKRTNDFAAFFGEAGWGKSSGIARYKLTNPDTVVISASHVCRSKWDMIKQLEANIPANELQRLRAEKGFGRGEAVFEYFRDTNRLVVIDNAQRLDNEAILLWFDFHDDTKCAVAITGNPEVLKRIRKIDPSHAAGSRVGLKVDSIDMPEEKITAAVESLLRELCAEHADAIQHLADQVARQPGHLRAVRKQVELMKELLNKRDSGLRPVDAFHAAHKLLMRDYALEEKQPKRGGR